MSKTPNRLIPQTATQLVEYFNLSNYFFITTISTNENKWKLKQIKPHKEVFNESAFNSALLFRDTIWICVSELKTNDCFFWTIASH